MNPTIGPNRSGVLSAIRRVYPRLSSVTLISSFPVIICIIMPSNYVHQITNFTLFSVMPSMLIITNTCQIENHFWLHAVKKLIFRLQSRWNLVTHRQRTQPSTTFEFALIHGPPTEQQPSRYLPFPGCGFYSAHLHRTTTVGESCSALFQENFMYIHTHSRVSNLSRPLIYRPLARGSVLPEETPFMCLVPEITTFYVRTQLGPRQQRRARWTFMIHTKSRLEHISPLPESERGANLPLTTTL